MKSCPTCQRQYSDETLGFCLEDGTRLVEMFDSAATWVSPPRANTDPEATRVTATPRHTDPTLVGPSNPSYQNPSSQNQSYPNPSYSPPYQPATKGRGKGIWIALGIGLVLLVIVGVAGAGLIYYFSGSSGTSSIGGGSSTPASTPAATPTPTPTPLPSISGTWKGEWKNSKGNGGNTTLEINEDSDGNVTGNEGEAFQFVNGRRVGNVMTWEYKNISNCSDYKNRWEIDPSGTTATGSYTVHDNCDGENFSGTYVRYTKQ